MCNEDIYKIPIILLLLTLFLMLPGINGNSSTPVDVNKGLGSALTDNGWELYTSTICGACQRQEMILGNEYDDVAKYEVGTEKFNVRAVEIGFTGLPTWFNSKTGEKLTGYRIVAELWNMT